MREEERERVIEESREEAREGREGEEEEIGREVKRGGSFRSHGITFR